MTKINFIGLLVIGSLIFETAHAERTRKPKEQNRVVQVVTANSPFLGGGLVGAVVAGVGLIGKQRTEKKVADKRKSDLIIAAALQAIPTQPIPIEVKQAREAVTKAQQDYEIFRPPLYYRFTDIGFINDQHQQEIFDMVIEPKRAEFIANTYAQRYAPEQQADKRVFFLRQLDQFRNAHTQQIRDCRTKKEALDSAITAKNLVEADFNIVPVQPAPVVDISKDIAHQNSLENARWFRHLMIAGVAIVVAAGVTWAAFELVRHYKEKKSSEKKVA